MNILIAADIFPPDIGGPATYAHELAHSLVERGHAVSVLCYQSKRMSLPTYPFTVACIDNALPVSLKYAKYYWSAVKLARSADVVYAMGPVNAGFPAIRAARKAGVPFAVKVVGDYAWEQAWVQKGLRMPFDEFQHDQMSGKIFLLREIQKYVTSHADTVIVPSEFLKKVARGWGVSEQSLCVIYNAANNADLKNNMTRSTAQKTIGIQGAIVLAVGRLVPWKNNEMFVDLWHRLLREIPQVKLVVVGEGEERSRIEKRIRTQQLEKAIFFVGKKSAAELAQYYAAASVVVLNSSYEGLSHVLLEAYRYGIPIIASDIPANREASKLGVASTLVPYNDCDAWLTALKHIVKEDAVSSKAIDAGNELPDIFSYEAMIRKTEKILENLNKNR